MFNINDDLLKALDDFVQREYVAVPEDRIEFFGCMDCSNYCAENCSVKCKKNGK